MSPHILAPPMRAALVIVPRVSRTIMLPHGVSVERIEDAVKRLAIDNNSLYERHLVSDDDGLQKYLIGMSSKYSNQDIAIMDGAGSPGLAMDTTYWSLKLVSHPWPGTKSTIDLTAESYVIAADAFQQQLEVMFRKQK